MLPCIQGLLKIRIFIQISSSNSTTTLQKRIIFLLKMDLMRLRESEQLVLGHPAQKLQSEFDSRSVWLNTQLPPQRWEWGPIGSWGALSPAFLSTGLREGEESIALCPRKETRSQEGFPWKHWVPSCYFPWRRQSTFQQGTCLRGWPSDVQMALLLIANQTLFNKHWGQKAGLINQNWPSHHFYVCVWVCIKVAIHWIQIIIQELLDRF